MKNTVRRLLAVVMAAFMVFTLSGAVFALEGATDDHAPIQAKKAVSYDLSGIRNGNTFDVGENTKAEIAADQIVPIMVRLQDAPVVRAIGNTRAGAPYAASLKEKQDSAAELIRSTFGVEVRVLANYTYLFNGFAFEGEYRLVEELNRMDGMSAFVAPTWDVPEIQISNAGDMVYVSDAYELGFTGAGYAIAIVDTGLKVDHPAFSTDPDEVAFTQEDIAALVNAGNLYGGSDMDVEDVYYSAKIPFRWNYYSNTYNVAHYSSDHGTHVAGIAAGNGGEIVGMAKDAQIFAMQVFQPSGGANWVQILAALEDCAKLGVDAANLSLGSPCGFTFYNNIYVTNESYIPAAVIEEVFECLHDAGVNLSISAGNEYSTALGNYWAASNQNIGYVLVQTPDYGVTGSPGSLPRSLSVASIDNAKESLMYIQNVATGEKFIYSESSYGQPLIVDVFPDTEVEYVAVPGTGALTDYEGLDVTGKIALVQRGVSSFSEKVLNAQAMGAVGVIVYNNQEGTIGMNLTDAQGKLHIPAISIEKKYGDPLAEAGTGKIYVSSTPEYFDSPTGGQPSSFSSWGTTSDLAIKPEIAGVGGNVYSSTDFGISGADYQSWSGTSMSAPQVGGSMLIVKAYVDEMFPDASDAERAELVDALLMCTAIPVKDTDGSLAAVRKQGAGLINLAGAASTTAYISVPGSVRPKLELGDDPEKTGVFEMTFVINNFGETNLSYVANPHVLIDDIQAIAADPNGNYVIAYTQTSADITEDCEIDAPDVINVRAGESVEVTITVTLTDSVKPYLDYYYTTGAYVEGFIELTSNGGTVLGDVDDDGEVTAADALLVMRYSLEICTLEHPETADVNHDGKIDLVDALLILRFAMDICESFTEEAYAKGVDLNVPFLGFYGDWNYNPMLNMGFYFQDFNYGSTPENNFAGDGSYGLGINPYVETEDFSYYLPERNAVSPNGDDFLDAITTLRLGLLRNASLVGVNLYDETGALIEELDYGTNWRKDYESTSTLVYSNLGSYLDISDFDFSEYEGKTIMFGVYAYLANDGAHTTNAFDPADNMFSEWKIPVYVDVTYPELEVVSFADGKLTLKASDDHFVAFVGALEGDVAADEEIGNQFYVSGIIDEVGLFEDAAGKTTEVELNDVEAGAYVAIADYAGNEVLYLFDGEELIPFNNNFSHPVFRAPDCTFYGFGKNFTSSKYWVRFTNDTMLNEDIADEDVLAGLNATVVCGTPVGDELYCIVDTGASSGDPQKYILAKYDISDIDNWGEIEPIAYVPYSYTLHEMAYNPVTKKLYVVEGLGLLDEIDMTTGEVISQVDIQYGACAIDFMPNGYCLIIDTYGYLSVLDETTGQELGDIAYLGKTVYSSTQGFFPQCGAYHDGVFFWFCAPVDIQYYSDMHLIAIDLATGNFCDMGPVYGGLYVSGLFVTDMPEDD